MTDDFAVPPRRVAGAEPPAPDPVFRYFYNPCVSPACGALNRRLATESAPTRCPVCGGPVMGASRRRALAVDGDVSW